jgi:outer membrane biosynthesis protein TonB
MDSYTITIAPNDDSGAATRLVVDTSGDQVRITDVHLHAPLGLSSGHIPTVDFALLLQAVTGSGAQTADGTTALVASQPSTPAIEAAPEPQPAPPAPKRRARKATPAVEAAPAKRAARPRTAKAAPVAEPRRQARTAKQTSAKTTKTTAAPAKKQTAGRTRAKAPATPAPAPSGRVYRRTPDDLAEIFEQVETVAGIAEHYGVPRYTAQGWVNRLRATA